IHLPGMSATMSDAPSTNLPAAPPTSPADTFAGQVLGDYRLVREIGRGGMGVVYEAIQGSLNRKGALKILPLAGALDPRRLQRFLNEARAAALLHHPNIVPVYAVGCEQGVHYYAMQLIDGETLATLLAALHPGSTPAAEDLTSPYLPASTTLS